MSEQDEKIETPEVEPKVEIKEEKEFIEINEDNFKKLKEIENNKTIALKLERENSAKLSEELKAFREKEAELEQKDKLKKGKYEELINELTESNTTLKEKAEAYDSLIQKMQEEKTAKLDILTKEIDEELLKENQFILEDLSDDKKILFLEKLKGQSEKKDFDITPKEGDKLNKGDDLEKAKQEGDVMNILANAKTI